MLEVNCIKSVLRETKLNFVRKKHLNKQTNTYKDETKMQRERLLLKEAVRDGIASAKLRNIWPAK